MDGLFESMIMMMMIALSVEYFFCKAARIFRWCVGAAKSNVCVRRYCNTTVTVLERSRRRRCRLSTVPKGDTGAGGARALSRLSARLIPVLAGIIFYLLFFKNLSIFLSLTIFNFFLFFDSCSFCFDTLFERKHFFNVESGK